MNRICPRGIQEELLIMKINYKKSYRFKDLPRETQKEQISIATRELTELVLNKMGTDLDAAVLYVLADRFGFGKHRLRKVYDGIFETRLELKKAWEGSDNDLPDDYRRELKKIGVDIELWNQLGRAWNDGGYKNDECWNAFGQKEWRGRK